MQIFNIKHAFSRWKCDGYVKERKECYGCFCPNFEVLSTVVFVPILEYHELVSQYISYTISRTISKRKCCNVVMCNNPLYLQMLNIITSGIIRVIY